LSEPAKVLCNTLSPIGFIANDYEFLKHFISYHSLEHRADQWLDIQDSVANDSFNTWLSDSYINKRQHNLLLWNEWTQISTASRQLNINLFLYKGLALSYQLYDDATIRPTRDLDVFVHTDDLFNADLLFKKMGYRRTKPDFELSKKQQKQIHHHIHHFSYVHPDKKILVELHWQLVIPQSLFPKGENVFNSSLSQASEPFQQYPWEWLLHYLIVHGSMHHWYKLVWLSDIDTILKKNVVHWDVFNSLTRTFDDERMVHSGFTLANRIFATPFPFDFSLNRSENKLVDFCMNSILKEQNYLKSKGFSRIRRVRYLALLRNSFKHKMNCWFAISTNSEDWKLIPLNDRWFFLYYLLRPFLMLYVLFFKRKHHNQ
jgi:hypothetical protein